MNNPCAYCSNDGELVDQYVVSKKTVKRLYMCKFHRDAQNQLEKNPVSVIAYISDARLFRQAKVSNQNPVKPHTRLELCQYIQNIGKVRTEPNNGMKDQERNNKMSSMFENELMLDQFEEEALKKR